jgi:hypothetical protein
MTTILSTLLDSGIHPVNLQESDIGQKFTFVVGNVVYTGTFNGFSNGNKNYALVKDFSNESRTFMFPAITQIFVGQNGFTVFRGSLDDIKIDISLDSLNHLLGQGDNPLTSDNSNLENLVAYTKPNGGKRRKTNKKRKMSKRRKMSRRN